MKKILMKLFFIIQVPIFLISCSASNNSSTIANYEYDMVANLHLDFKNIFNVDKKEYYVYFYSKNCLHCLLLKNEIIPLALKKDNLFFVEYVDEIPIGSNVIATIGVTSIDEFFIVGTPTLIYINDQRVEINTCDEDIILSLLKGDT